MNTTLPTNETHNSALPKTSLHPIIEENYPLILNSTIDGFLITDCHGRILEANESYRLMTGYTNEELRDLTLYDLNTPKYADLISERIEQLIEEKQVRFKTQHLTKSGKPVDLDVSAIYLEHEGEGCLSIFYRDITGQKQAEAALQQSEERYRAFIEQSSEGIWRFELEEPIPIDLPVEEQVEQIYQKNYLAECNDALAQQYGFERAKDLIGKPLSELYEGVEKENRRYIRAFIEAGYNLADAKSHRKDAAENDKYYLNNLFGIVKNGNLVRIWGTQRDVTENRQTVKALRRSEERLRLTFEAVQMGLWEWNPLTHEVEIDAKTMQLFGITPKEFDGTDRLFVERIHPEDRHHTHKLMSISFSERRSYKTEFRVILPDGKVRWLMGMGIGFYDNDGELINIIGVNYDISERKEAEIALRESEARFHEIADYAPVMIWMSGSDKACFYFNKRWLDFTGRRLEQEIGIGWTENIHTGDLDSCLRVYNEAFDARQSFEIEYRVRRFDGEYRWILVNAAPRFSLDGEFIGYFGSCIDITERKQTEQALLNSETQMRQAQKMEAIGKLTGGIAHDFNNLLAVIILQVDMLNLQIRPDNPMYHRINEIKSAANRAASLTKQLLAFSRKQMLQPRPVVLNHVIAGMNEILHRLLGEDIELHIRLAPDLGICLVDPDQMSQVLMNLIVNARDAMPDGGTLTIKTANVRLDDRTRQDFASQPAGEYVELTVADTGCGMDAATEERIFEPFFTTKGAGKGTGLGLSTAYGIVKQSEGFIWVETELGKGTTFKVQLPTINKMVERTTRVETSPVHLIGKDTILLVEDDKVIRRAALEVLRMFGYLVLAASGGDEAIEFARTYEHPIHLLLTDVVMPKMNGKELAGRIKELRPEIKVLYMSGYTDDIIARHGVLEDGIMFIEKPFTPSALGQKVREAIKGK